MRPGSSPFRRLAPQTSTASTVSTALVAGVAVVLGLAGCGSPTGTGPAALPGTEEYFATPCPEPGVRPAGTEFTYWSMWTADEPQARVLQHAVDCFTEKTGVQVTVQWLGRKLLTQNVAPALNAGEVPDLIDQDLSQLKAAVVAPGGTQSVEDVYGMKVGEGDRTVEDVLARYSHDLPQHADAEGNRFLVPYEMITNAWWYDRNTHPDLTPPRTMDELFALFEQELQAGRPAISQDGDISHYNAYFFTQLAARFVGPGGIAAAAADRTGESWRTEPGFLAAARLVERIATGGYFAEGWDAAKFPQVQQRWADGETAYTFNGTWLPSETREYLNKQGGGREIQYGSFQFPMSEGATHDIVEQMPIGFAVPAPARNAEPAKAFIAYVLHKDILQGIPTVSDNLAPRTDLPVPADLADAKAALDDPDKEHTLVMDGLDGLFGGTYVDTVFFPADDALLRGQITAEQFIDRMATDTATYWKSRG
ncbi:raffinose/stachyose/melibiose transport system substrate-binding protein [Amycolatopsis arida]|uniref:Raffinose/stachyose/melibiose transport system substrate-binding protein n=1 Tax=Amycolatopsis arida TaxID=587909 RepID=A0A1I5LJ34_9PSEU|nr:ABC transporter substrate-binding protein [Amycolatopsis arida]TDX93742.1 raffinose/stachyose/melibiose transport system substrate-binding protein [Amycolatopsis arida]SFO97394.1 raffinose/stachyose/melibiose transport system substrate-binding protein [Amycolatopsis arida]